MEGSAIVSLLSYGTVLAQAATLVLLVLLVRDWRAGWRDAFTTWLHRNGLGLAGAVALAAALGSLALSGLVGYAPCKLCWYQRSFMYPLAVILPMAAWLRDRRIIRYALALVLVGGFVALNHTILQGGGTSLIPCSAPGIGTQGCDQRFVFEFGFVTVPLMSLTAFSLVAVLLGHASSVVRAKR